MSLAVLADHLADKGRHGDSMLVHMSPEEVASLQQLAQAHGMELTINPETGLPEAWSLKSLLPVLAGAALNFFAPGVGTAIGSALGGLSAAAGSAIAVGGIATLATGSLEKGLMAGLGAYGGAGLTDALLAGGAGAAGAAGALGVPGAATGVGSQAAMLAEQTAGFGSEGIKALADSAAYAKGATPSLTAALSAGAEAAKNAPFTFAKNNIGSLVAAASPVMADAMVPTTTQMPTLATSTPYIRPMVMTRRVNPNPQFAPGTGSSERRWFDTKYEMPPPVNLLTGKQVTPTAAPSWTPPTTTPSPENPYDQQDYQGGGFADGGMVAFAEGGAPAISRRPNRLFVPAQTTQTLEALPPSGTIGIEPWYTERPQIVQSKVKYGKAPIVVEPPAAISPRSTGTSMTGDSKAAFDYLMGNAPAKATTPESGGTTTRRTTQNIVMPRFVPDTTSSTAGAGGSGVTAGGDVATGAGVGDIGGLAGFGGTDVTNSPSNTGQVTDTTTAGDTDTGTSLTGGIIPAIVGTQDPAPVETRVGTPVADVLTDSTAPATDNPFTGDTSLGNVGDTTPAASDTPSSDALDAFLQLNDYFGAGPSDADTSVVTPADYYNNDISPPVSPGQGSTVEDLYRQPAIETAPADAWAGYQGGDKGTEADIGNPFASDVGLGAAGDTSYADYGKALDDFYSVDPGLPDYTNDTAAPVSPGQGSTVEDLYQQPAVETTPADAWAGYQGGDRGTEADTGPAATSSDALDAFLQLNDYFGTAPQETLASLAQDYAAYTPEPVYSQPVYQPEPAYQPEPTYSQPEPTYYQPEPTYNQPTYQPEPTYYQPEPTYSPPVYQPEPSYAYAPPPTFDSFYAGNIGPSADFGMFGGGGGGNDFMDFNLAANGGLMATGGIAGLQQHFNLGGYSDGGRLLRGPGDGVSDSIPATIGHGRQPARLADGEFVIPARIVSELGNGSTEAGARQLYAMMDRIQKARSKTVGKGRVAKDTRAHKYLPA